MAHALGAPRSAARLWRWAPAESKFEGASQRSNAAFAAGDAPPPRIGTALRKAPVSSENKKDLAPPEIMRNLT